MKISEIDEDSENINIEGKVVDIEPVRAISTKYGQGKLALAHVEDDSGEIELVLWGDQVENTNVGDEVKVEGAFVRDFNDYLQLSIPREGSLEVL